MVRIITFDIFITHKITREGLLLLKVDLVSVLRLNIPVDRALRMEKSGLRTARV